MYTGGGWDLEEITIGRMTHGTIDGISGAHI